MATNENSGDGNIFSRQENEYEAIKSIYGNNFIDLRELEQQNPQKRTKTKQNERLRLPAFKITLFPLNSQSQSDNINIYVQIDLKIEFTPTYPNKMPKLTLENDKGLSLELKKQIQDKIIKKGKSLIGKEMVYELCQEIQEFLYEHNNPPLKSFYDQMLDNKKKQEFYNEQQQHLDVCMFDIERKKFEEEHFDELNEELMMKHKLLREEMKQKRQLVRRERLSSSCSTNSPSSHPKSGNSKNNSESDNQKEEEIMMTMATFKSFTIEFNEPISNKRKVNCIKLIKEIKDYNFKAYRAIDSNTNDICVVYEWAICLEKNKIFESKKLDNCLIEFKKIEEEIRKLIKLNNNTFLIRYLAYKAFKQIDRPYFIIQLCLNNTEANTLDLFLTKKSTIQYSALQMYTIELIKILEYLHSNHVYHRDLKASSIYLDNNGSLKLSDYSTVKRINNLYELVVNEAQNSLTANSKTDIHQLGLVLLSLALGEQVNDYHPKIPSNLPIDFKNFISKCLQELITDVKTLLSHPFLTKKLDDKMIGASTKGFKEEISTNKFSIIKTAAAKVNDDISMIEDSRDYDESQEEDGEIEKFNDYPKDSRLNTEFKVLGKVGSGAFGVVLKVENRIDMCTYAIKRIRLNPSNEVINKQITREIKLLSRLNHENVVRYYSTWMEKHEIDANETTDTTEISHQTTEEDEKINKRNKNNKKNKKIKSKSSFSNLLLKQSNINLMEAIATNNNNNDDDDDDFSSFNQKVTTLSISSSSESSSSSSNHPFRLEPSLSDDNDDCSSSISFRSSESDKNNNPVIFNVSPSKKFEKQLINKNKKRINSDNEEDDDDDDDSIVFENDGKKEDSEEKIEEIKTTPTSSNIIEKHRVFVFIQMEYCEGRTLKDLIDKELYKSVDRVWSLFREILQGLNHIHELGMIHRDLKPRNVLIDANGHAKIGDFGLATTKILRNDSISSPNNPVLFDINDYSTHNSATTPSNLDSTSLSGHVGTALYVAPELLIKRTNKYVYTQKVDIYSLGIMFYEMCFPFTTNMERVNVLMGLSTKIFNYPKGFDLEKYKNQIKLIEDMLCHNPDERPSAKDLLTSELIPRKANEIALDQLLKDSLSTRSTNNYRKILKSVFDQNIAFKDDISYDYHNIKPVHSFKQLQIREYVYNNLVKVFQKNGAYLIKYPLLIPFNELSREYNNSFQLVDSSGLVLSLPYNHRAHFARYIARSNCTNLKRYYIGNVYQLYSENLRFIGNHPRENTEASYDIVTSTNADFLPEIEILWLLNDIICSFNELSDQEYKLVINHSLLLNAIMLYSGIKQDDIESQKRVYTILVQYNKIFKLQEIEKEVNKETRENWLKEKILSSGFNESTMNRLIIFLIKFGSVEKILTEMKNLTKHETQFGRLTKEAINQIKFITSSLAVFNIKYQLFISTSFILPLIANPSEYNGLLFALYRRKNKKNEYEILASGGRYDRLVKYFCFTTEPHKQYAIGVSIDFGKIVNLIVEKSEKQQQQPQQSTSSSSSSANNYQSQLIVFSHGLNLQQVEGHQIQLLNQIDIKNRLNLFNYIYYLFKSSSVCIQLNHEKLTDLADMDNYCKKNSILNYIYLNNSEPQAIVQTSKLFHKYDSNNVQDNLKLNLSSLTNNSADEEFNLNNIEFNVRSFTNSKGASKYLDKKYKLNDFLFNLHKFLSSTFTPLTLLSTIINTQITTTASSSLIHNYIEFVINSTNFYHPHLQQPQQPQQQTQNIISQTNVTVLIESNSRSSTPGASSNSSNNNSGMMSSSLTSSNSSLNSLNLNSRNSNAALNYKKIESQTVTRLAHILQLFSNRTRIEVIAIEIIDSVLQQLANSVHFDCDEQHFALNWKEFLEKLNPKCRKQIVSFKLEEILRDLRYKTRSKVFIIYSLKSEQYKIFVAP